MKYLAKWFSFAGILLLFWGCGTEGGKDIVEVEEVEEIAEVEETVDICKITDIQIQVLKPNQGEVIHGEYELRIRVLYNDLDDSKDYIKLVGAVIQDSTGSFKPLGKSDKPYTKNTYKIVFDSTKFKDGKYKIFVQVEDVNGCLKTLYKATAIEIDNSGPEIKFLFPEDGGTFRSYINVIYTISDPHLVDVQTFSVNGTPLYEKKLENTKKHTFYVDIPLDKVFSGTLKFDVVAKDSLGNTSQNSLSINVLSKFVSNIIGAVKVPYLDIKNINYLDFFRSDSLRIVAIATDSGIFVSEMNAFSMPVHFFRLTEADSAFVHLEDFDGDGAIDVLSIDRGSEGSYQFSIYQNIEEALLKDVKKEPDYVKSIDIPEFFPSAIYFGDINDDGKTDYVVGTKVETVGVLVFYGVFDKSEVTDPQTGEKKSVTIFLKDPIQVAGAYNITDIDVDDLNGDGAPDIVLGRDDFDIISILYGYQNKEEKFFNFYQPVNVYTCFEGDKCKNVKPATVEVKNLYDKEDEDYSYPEIVLGKITPITIGTPDQNNEITSKTIDGAAVVQVLEKAGKLNADYGGLKLFINEAKKQVDSQMVPALPRDIYVTDINQDGAVDILATGYDSGVLTVSYGIGEVTFRYKDLVNYPIGEKPTFLYHFNIDDDPEEEIFVLHDKEKFFNILDPEANTKNIKGICFKIDKKGKKHPPSGTFFLPFGYKLAKLDAGQVDLLNGGDVVAITTPQPVKYEVPDPNQEGKTKEVNTYKTLILFYPSTEVKDENDEVLYSNITNEFYLSEFPFNDTLSKWVYNKPIFDFRLGNFVKTKQLDIAAIFQGDKLETPEMQDPQNPENTIPAQHNDIFAIMRYDSQTPQNPFKPVSFENKPDFVSTMSKIIHKKALQIETVKLTNLENETKYTDLAIFFDAETGGGEDNQEGNTGTRKRGLSTYNAVINSFLAKGDGTFKVYKIIEPEMFRGPHNFSFFDIDGDGLLDMLLPQTETGDITIVKNKGGGQFYQKFHHYSVGLSPVKAIATDWDADGIVDLIILLSDDVVIAYGKGNDEFEPPKYFYYTTGKNYPASDPVDMIVFDANRDGFSDIIILNKGSNNILIFYSPGKRIDPPFYDPDIIPIPEGGERIVLTDIDNDGCEDFIIPSPDFSMFSTLINLTCDYTETE